MFHYQQINRIIATAIFILAAFTFCTAQSDSTKTKQLYRPTLALKYNPIALFAYTSGFEVGVEHSLSEHTSLQYAANLINDFGIKQDQDFWGFKLLTEYRHYNLFNKTQLNNWYSGIQISYKEVFVEGRDYISRANGNYQQLFDIKAKTTSFDFLLTHGISEILTKWSYVEVSMTYGAKQLNLTYDGLPEDAIYESFNEGFGDFQIRAEGIQWYPVLRFHAKINFILKK